MGHDLDETPLPFLFIPMLMNVLHRATINATSWLCAKIQILPPNSFRNILPDTKFNWKLKKKKKLPQTFKTTMHKKSLQTTGARLFSRLETRHDLKNTFMVKWTAFVIFSRRSRITTSRSHRSFSHSTFYSLFNFMVVKLVNFRGEERAFRSLHQWWASLDKQQ